MQLQIISRTSPLGRRVLGAGAAEETMVDDDDNDAGHVSSVHVKCGDPMKITFAYDRATETMSIVDLVACPPTKDVDTQLPVPVMDRVDRLKALMNDPDNEAAGRNFEEVRGGTWNCTMARLSMMLGNVSSCDAPLEQVAAMITTNSDRITAETSAAHRLVVAFEDLHGAFGWSKSGNPDTLCELLCDTATVSAATAHNVFADMQRRVAPFLAEAQRRYDAIEDLSS